MLQLIQIFYLPSVLTILKFIFREIEEPKNVEPLYNVLTYDPYNIKKAVLYATKSTLVCETAEDAFKVAYENGEKCYNVSEIH